MYSNNRIKFLIVLFFFLNSYLLLAANTVYVDPLPISTVTQRIQEALDTVGGGGIVYLKASNEGSHYITKTIYMRANYDHVTLRCEEGAVMRKVHNAFEGPVIEFENGSYNNIVDRVNIDGGEWIKQKTRGDGIRIFGTYNVVSNSKIHHNYGHGIMMDGQHTETNNNKVVGCEVYINYSIGISQHSHENGIISYNTVWGNYLEGITIDCGSNYCECYSNTLKNNCRRGGGGGISLDNVTFCVLYDNNIQSTKNGRGGITFNCESGDVQNITVYSNFLGDNQGYGLNLRASNEGSCGNGGSSHNNFIYLNNTKGNTLGPFNADNECSHNNSHCNSGKVSKSV